MVERLQNFIDGAWSPSSAEQALNVLNPASAQVLAQVPLSPAAEVNQAAESAARAFIGWRRTPVGDRIVPLFKLRGLLEANREDLSRSITDECGKTMGRAGPRFSGPLKTWKPHAACP